MGRSAWRATIFRGLSLLRNILYHNLSKYKWQEKDAKKFGFKNIYLDTDHIGYYDHYGFKDLANVYDPWGEGPRI